MILSAEALDILSFLKTAPGKFVSMLEISRRAGGRRRFEESPAWAKNLMSPMMSEGLIEVNSRGHYRLKGTEQTPSQVPATKPSQIPWKPKAKIVGDDYFPTSDLPKIVAGDYFPTSDLGEVV